MKHLGLTLMSASAAILLAVGMPLCAATTEEPESKWAGVDETVVERVATEAGRPPRDPYINVGEGDMLLFCFLLAGTIGGFIGGYYFRVLFKKEGAPAR